MLVIRFVVKYLHEVRVGSVKDMQAVFIYNDVSEVRPTKDADVRVVIELESM